MDHIPPPENANTAPFRVPFLVRIFYNIGNIKTFPSRHGFNLEVNEGDKCSVEDLASLLQLWMYFGLLAEFTGQSIPRLLYMCRTSSENEQGEDFVSAVSLLRGLDLPLSFLKYDDDDDQVLFSRLRQRWRTAREELRLLDLLQFARKQCESLDKRYPTAPEPLPVIILSIRVLIDTLEFVCLGAPTDFVPPLLMENAQSTASSELIARVMESNGWCPFQINHILRTFHAPAAVYISQIRRSYKPGITHQYCSIDECLAFNIDERTYKTHHVRHGCDCSFVSIPTSQMRQIIDEGGIPLAVLEYQQNGRLSLGVKAAGPRDLYVAFSHVWSDGLGNTTKNSLPECQLRRLQNYIERSPHYVMDASFVYADSRDSFQMEVLHPPKYFWIDTLCIPVASADDDMAYVAQLKQRMIAKITPIFALACRVIVLDHEMQQVDVEGRQWTEIAARVLYSVWMGRCWTLEEGAVNITRHIQGLHGAFDPLLVTRDRSKYSFLLSTSPAGYIGETKRFMARMSNSSLNIFRRKQSQQDIYRQMLQRRIRRMLNYPLEQALERSFTWSRSSDLYMPRDVYVWKFVTYWNALARRQTSRPKDKIAILASLLDLDTFTIKRTVPPMMAIIKTLPVVPLSVLYVPRCHEPRKQNGLQNHRNSEDLPTPAYEDVNAWLPKYPISRLHVTPAMSWADDWLQLDKEPLSTQMVIIESSILSFPGFILEEITEDRQYLVEFMKPATYCLQDSHSRKACLLIEREDIRQRIDPYPSLQLRGACLRVLDITGDCPAEDSSGYVSQNVDLLSDEPHRINVSAVYNFPIRVTVLSKATLSMHDTYTVVKSKTLPSWTLKLKHGKSALLIS